MKIILKDADLFYLDSFFSLTEADLLFQYFRKELLWQQDEIKIFGKVHQVPRLQAWYGDDGKSYTYSGIDLQPLGWDPKLKEIKNKIESLGDFRFNSVLANLYRNGRDSNGWHSDDEKELGQNPVIASISLGESRKFKLKHKDDKALKYDLMLAHGSLLIMSGLTQHKWKHTIAKSSKELKERINLTYRQVL